MRIKQEVHQSKIKNLDGLIVKVNNRVDTGDHFYAAYLLLNLSATGDKWNNRKETSTTLPRPADFVRKQNPQPGSSFGSPAN